MVAVAILAMVLVTLLGVKNRSMQDVMLADHITTATLLAKREMTEMLQNKAAPAEGERDRGQVHGRGVQGLYLEKNDSLLS